MEAKLYYTPPKDEEFNELKEKAIELWTERYPEETSPHYAKEKVDRIKDIENVEDNFMYIVSMFDMHNQARLSQMISDETRKEIINRLRDSGTPEELIFF